MIRRLVLLPMLFALVSCETARKTASTPLTPGDPQNAPSYGYHPIDPLPVFVKMPDDRPQPTSTDILGELPDETMRIAIGEIQGSGNITFGPAKTGVAGRSYVVILDYIKFQTQSFAVVKKDGRLQRIRDFATFAAPGPAEIEKNGTIVPVYVGVGLRLTANITVTEGTVDLGNLFALGVAAQSKQVTGTMVVQTLGVSGQNISTLIPMPSEINPTTLQNAILALGAIKAKLYDQGTTINPRVVGVYNNLGGGQETINAFISMLLDEPKQLFLTKIPTAARSAG